MKVLIASDIHGNLEYTKKLDELCDKENFDKIILLGDLIHNYYYYDPEEEKEVATILNKRANITTSIIGNCDREYEIEKLNFPVAFEIDKIDLDNHSFFLTHGHLYSKYADLIEDKYTFVGHSHVYNMEGKHLNPGSVGFPRNHKEHTCFIYNDHILTLIDIDTHKILQKRELK